ncbi:hypothetical protein [Haloferula sp. BvORR071]|uniref:hypothetical protein n=1 Tax=Haloferula sp. BvORR071 TaxID=1396141 RepID=UPI002240F534|nr:hypothetical protein [Haloferula sp. BvORR071]
MRTTNFIFLLMGILSIFGCSKPKPKETTVSQKETTISKKETAVFEKAFGITLPGEWSRRSEDGGSRIVFSSSATHEQLTVSLMPSSTRMDPALRLSTFNQVMELRRQAETHGLPPSAIKMTAPSVSEMSGIHSGRYSGSEPASQRRFTCLLFCSSSLVATFYYEAIGLPQSEADERANAILGSAKLNE